ncbi:DUF4097 domain-containing protein [Paenibacillus yanchengensis]|uniref:DUF4097 domain-containing protein n=1 Tax=Paenibacillus yanchengensis TaxID=2035833 RepID=A0ABW4YHI0_9BACL
MKKSSLGGLLLVVIGIALLLVLTTDSGATSFQKLWSSLSKEINLQEQLPTDLLEQLVIDTSSVNVVVRKGQQPEATAHLTGTVRGLANKDYFLDLQENDAKAILSAGTNSNNILQIGFSNVKLIVTLPEKTWSALTIQTKSGNINVAEQLADELVIQAKSGNVTASELSAANIDIQTASGNVKLEQLDSFKVNLQTSSGNVKVKQLHAEKLQFNTQSGNANFDGGAMQVIGETKSGNMKLELDAITEDSLLQANSGNVKVKLREKPTNLTVDFIGNSGKGSISKTGFEYRLKNNDRHNFIGQFGSGEMKLEVKTRSGNFSLE